MSFADVGGHADTVMLIAGFEDNHVAPRRDRLARGCLAVLAGMDAAVLVYLVTQLMT